MRDLFDNRHAPVVSDQVMLELHWFAAHNLSSIVIRRFVPINSLVVVVGHTHCLLRWDDIGVGIDVLHDPLHPIFVKQLNQDLFASVLICMMLDWASSETAFALQQQFT